MSKTVIRTADAPTASSLFSQGIRAGGFIYTAQVGISPSGGSPSADVGVQTTQCLKNIQAVLACGGGTLEDVVQLTIYMVDLADGPALNESYRSFFPSDPPSRACIEVRSLGPGIRVEMQAVAYIGP